MKQVKRHVLVPLVLLLYLAVMAYMGLEGLRSGATPPAQYFGTLVITLGIIILLYFFMKKRDRLRRERLEDIKESNKDNNKDTQNV